MNLTAYPLKSSTSLMVFEFTSVGPKGSITKLVKYSKLNDNGLYNLAFGDKVNENGDINDSIISNNGDSEIVLATVVRTLYIFTNTYPNTCIYASGSTKGRTRLYRIGITKYLPAIKLDFYLFGWKDGILEHFRENEPYEAFLITRKKLSL